MGRATGAVVGALALGAVAVALGAAHSLIVPIKLAGDTPAPQESESANGGGEQAAPAEASGDPSGAPAEGGGEDPRVPVGVGARDQDPPPAHAASAFELIGMDRARALWDGGVAVFIDARPLEQYEAGHIQSAYWMPASEITGAMINELDRYAGPRGEIVIYCVGGDCDSSENVAIRLQEVGFENLLIMRDGYDDWVAAGYETEAGPPPEIE